MKLLHGAIFSSLLPFFLILRCRSFFFVAIFSHSSLPFLLLCCHFFLILRCRSFFFVAIFSHSSLPFLLLCCHFFSFFAAVPSSLLPFFLILRCRSFFFVAIFSHSSLPFLLLCCHFFSFFVAVSSSSLPFLLLPDGAVWLTGQSVSSYFTLPFLRLLLLNRALKSSY